MTRFTQSDDLQGAEFLGADLSRARFVGADLSGAVLRGVQVEGAEIDAPWLFEGDPLVVNGVDVTPYVDAELDRRFPGRSERTAGDPETLRHAWAVLEAAWTSATERAEGMPPGTVDVSVAGEWSFAQTLRHLVHATDTWLRKAALENQDPYHPLGLANSDAGVDQSAATSGPPYDDVLAARADRTGQVRDFLASATDEELAVERRDPHAPEYPVTVLACLHVILEEEWEHLRYATRDLDAIAAGQVS